MGDIDSIFFSDNINIQDADGDFFINIRENGIMYL